MSVSLLPLAVGFLNLRRISRLAYRAADPEWSELISALSHELGLRRGVRLVFSSASSMPMTWGWPWRVENQAAVRLGFPSDFVSLFELFVSLRDFLAA
jgi:hypothetical protein